MLGGLAAPVLWLAGRPSVYEAAIAGGQFFLLLGLYGALRSDWIFPETRSRSAGWLLLAGLGWARGSRLPVDAGPGRVGADVIHRDSHPAPVTGWIYPTTKIAIWLGVPPALFAAGLLAYNYVRFGDVLETGHRYQLTGPALPADYSLVTSTRYILPGLYGYLARPLHFSTEFPYVFAPFVTEQMWPFFIHLPEHYYYPERWPGSPSSSLHCGWVSCRPSARSLRVGAGSISANCSPPPMPISSASGGWSALVSAVLLAPLLVFISASMRYLADVTWLATGLVASGWWWGLHVLREYPLPRKLLLWAGALLLIASILLSLLLNFNGPEARIELNNPAFYATIRGLLP